MNRREFLQTGGGVSVGAASGVVGYELLFRDYISGIVNPEPSQSTTNTLNLDDISEVDVFLIAGQSNALGAGNKSESPVPESNTSGMYQLTPPNAPFQPLIDSVGIEPHLANTGSAWPAFADTYWDGTGRVSIYVPTAIGATGMHPKAGGAGTWGGKTLGLLYRALGLLQGATNNLSTMEIDYQYKGILWHQGERDAGAIDSGDLTSKEYRTAFEEMIAHYRSELSDPTAPFYIFQTGRLLDGDTTGFQQVRETQRAISENNQNISMVFDDCVRFAEDEMMRDNYHYNQTALNEMGRIGAENVLESTINNSTSLDKS